MEAERYGAVETPQGVVAANPAQGFSARFGPTGPTLVPEGGGDWELAVTTTGVGRGAALVALGASRAAVAPDARVVEYARPGLTEWYRNGPAGLEQGFTLAERPPGPGLLGVEVRFGGAFALSIEPGGDAVSLRHPGGTTLVYSGLYAYDAGGRFQPARMEARPGGVVLVVDDRAATYPLTVDPTIYVEQAKLTASDAAAGEEFGGSAAISGDTAVVGARLDDDAGADSGAAYVFVRSVPGCDETAQL